jgi:hypothetical protein
MGGTTNATDNFKAPTEAEVHASAAEPHVHGPDCGHGHSHEGDKHPQGKYASPAEIPTLDLKASFALNNEGPVWRKTPQELLTNIAFHAASVPAGGVRICFVNNEAYKFLLALRDFHKHFTPSPTIELQKQGVLGLFNTKIIIASDALWEPNEQVTLHKAIYFCDEVLDASVTEVLIETAEPPPPVEEIAEDVLDKEKGRCINCLDTGLIAGDLDQVCECPAGTDGGKREAVVTKTGADFSEIQ